MEYNYNHVSAGYVYQPDQRLTDFEQAVAVLRSKYPDVKPGWVDPRPYVGEISEGIRSCGISLEHFKPDVPVFATYFWKAEYVLRYPDYYRGNLPEKALEHFIALQMLNPGPSDILIDIASEGSPLPEIASRLRGCTAYAQDIMYEPGLNGSRIGGDACVLPVPDGFATCVTLTCSLDHFEGDSDTRLFRELRRVLKPGGRVVVIPCYLANAPAIVTDPTYSAPLDIPFDPGIPIYCAQGWKNRHGRWYSPETLQARVVAACPEMRFTVYRLIETEMIHPSIYARFCLMGERV